MRSLIVIAILFFPSFSVLKASSQIPDEWFDKATGYKVVRLSRREGRNTAFYFHQKSFTASGDKMLFCGSTTKDSIGLFYVNMNDFSVHQLTERYHNSVVLAPKSREVYYLNHDNNAIEAINLDTEKNRIIAKLSWKPTGLTPLSISCDENLLAAAYSEGTEKYYELPRSEWFNKIFEAKLLNKLFVVDIASGKITIIHSENTWLGHVQFSPTDPNLIMFCHEGPWNRLQRIWLINADGSKLQKVHPSNVDGEVQDHFVGHEFWDPNGRYVWYDFRTPFVGGNYFLAGENIYTGREFRYILKQEWFSYHYNISHDGTMFAADGCGEEDPGGTKNGRWIYLFKRIDNKLDVQKLVSLADHDYTTCEPLVQFSPDDSWIVFQSNMHGTNQVYGVNLKLDKKVNTNDKYGEKAEYDVGNLYNFLNKTMPSKSKLSFLSSKKENIEDWRARCRDKMKELLSFDKSLEPANVQILTEEQKNGYQQILLKYEVVPDQECEAYLLIPDNFSKPAAGILALHDHGGYYYYGKEKIVETDNSSPSLKEHINRYYGGRTYANELARKGFVVLAPDAFYFGSQKLKAEELPEQYITDLEKLKLGSDEYIKAYQFVIGRHEELVAKTIFTSGVTWPGIMVHSDRVALSYLLSRPEVDKDKIGCIGLSIGGFRSAYLFGLDSRIKVGIDVGWMTTFRSLLANNLWCHTWMIYVPYQAEYFDLPDIVSIGAPKPFMVINCLQDILFTPDGMKDAQSHIKQVYNMMGRPENFACRYFNVPHSFPVKAQDVAMKWFEKHLK